MRASEKRAFTLLEMLVVISIMALLTAILVPALSTARSQANGAVCLSNLRQLLLANIGYATENGGFYVPAASDLLDNCGRRRWHGIRDSLNEPFDPSRGPLAKYLKDGKVKQCPEKVQFIKGQGWGVNFEEGCGGYGYNMTYLGSRLWQKGYGFADKMAYAKTTQISEVARPSETLMFADTAFYQNDAYLIEYSFAEPRYWVFDGQIMSGSYPLPSIHFRHRKRAGVGWTDGHADQRQMANSDSSAGSYADYAKLLLGWFEPIDNTLFDLK